MDGGYVPLIVGFAFATVMVVWARGRSLVSAYFRERSEPTEHFLATLADRTGPRLPGVGVVMTATHDSIPPVLLRVVQRFRAVHEVILLTTVLIDEVPFVTDTRAQILPIAPGMYRVLLRYGFMENPQVHEALTHVLPQVAPDVKPEAVTYVLGQERYLGGHDGKMGLLAERIFAFLSRNAHNPTDYYALPPSQVVEVGARVDL